MLRLPGQKLFILLILFLCSCNNLYKAGNRLPMMDLRITTNVSDELIYDYLDTVKFNIDSSKRYIFSRSGGDFQYFPSTNKIAYFVDSPFEAYHLSSNGLFNLAEVYNPSMQSMDWITQSYRFSIEDYIRIAGRIDSLIKKVVANARAQHTPDTVIFWKKPYDTVICKLSTPYNQ